MSNKSQVYLNVTIREIEEFIFSFQNESSFHLDVITMAQAFMNKYSEHDFEAEYDRYLKENPGSQEITSVYSYISNVYFGFRSSLKKEYDTIEKAAKKRVKEYSDNVTKLDRIIESIPNEERLKKEKMKFYRDVNSVLLQQASADKEKPVIFRKAVSNIRGPKMLSSFLSPDWKYFDYRQYVNFDIRNAINFANAQIPHVKQINRIKKEQPELYPQAFREYITQYQIVPEIQKCIKFIPELKERTNLFETALALFEAENYEGFVYLMVPQVEGLFSVYCKMLGISDIENRFSITEKLEAAYEKEKFFGFVYYSYDFPQIRNAVAHGSIIQVTEIDAYELLTDFHFITTKLIQPLLDKKSICDKKE